MLVTFIRFSNFYFRLFFVDHTLFLGADKKVVITNSQKRAVQMMKFDFCGFLKNLLKTNKAMLKYYLNKPINHTVVFAPLIA